MIRGDKITVVIPCKNEQDSIIGTINAIPDYVDEILVVDNGSSDKTVERVATTRARVLKENRKLNGIGYGYALIKGFNEATGDYIFTIDADGSHPATKIRTILNYMKKNKFDVISCSRLPLSNSEAISTFRKIGIYVLNIEAYLLFGVKIKDMLSGMFGIKRSALSKLDLKMGDWNLSPEIKIAASTNAQLKFGEYLINQIPRTGGVSKQVVWATGKSHMLYILNRRIQNYVILLNKVKTNFHSIARSISVRFYSK